MAGDKIRLVPNKLRPVGAKSGASHPHPPHPQPRHGPRQVWSSTRAPVQGQPGTWLWRSCSLHAFQNSYWAPPPQTGKKVATIVTSQNYLYMTIYLQPYLEFSPWTFKHSPCLDQHCLAGGHRRRRLAWSRSPLLRRVCSPPHRLAEPQP